MLRAPATAGTAKRVVMISSFAAIGYRGHQSSPQRPFTEAEWTNSSGMDIGVYTKSKGIAGKTARDFVEEDPNGKGLELAVINPTGIHAPLVSKKYATSVELVTRMLKGQMSLAPGLQLYVVDVLDVVEAHVKAMTASGVAGKLSIST